MLHTTNSLRKGRAFHYRVALLTVVAAVAVSQTHVLAADNGCPDGYLSVKGEDSLLEKGTREAKKTALRLAQLRAVEQACRASIASERIHIANDDAESSSSVLLARSGGRTVDTKNVQIRVVPAPPGAGDDLYMRLEADACVKVVCDETSRRDPYFSLLSVELSDAKGRAATSFFEGDALSLEVRPSKDAYFTILSVFAGNDGVLVARRIYPNDVEREPRLVAAGTAFRYPPREKNGDSGLGLIAILPEGKAVSPEQIWIIATRKPWPSALSGNGQPKIEPGSGGPMLKLDERNLDDWNRYVTEMPGTEITDQMVTFTIFPR